MPSHFSTPVPATDVPRKVPVDRRMSRLSAALAPKLSERTRTQSPCKCLMIGTIEGTERSEEADSRRVSQRNGVRGSKLNNQLKYDDMVMRVLGEFH